VLSFAAVRPRAYGFLSVRSPPDFDLFPVPPPNLAVDFGALTSGVVNSIVFWHVRIWLVGLSRHGRGKVRYRGRVPASSPGLAGRGTRVCPSSQREPIQGTRDFTKKVEVGRLGFLPARRSYLSRVRHLGWRRVYDFKFE